MHGRDVEVIAHRGYSGRAPENTLAALRLALEAGADGIEFDLQVSADGVPVLLHDDMLDRTTNGIGPVALIELRELRQLDAGSWRSPAFAGERIATLAEALALAAGCARVYPEIKGFRTLSDVDRVLHALRDAGLEDEAVVISLAWDAVERLRRASDVLSLGYIAETPDRFEDALRLATTAIEDAGTVERAVVDCDYRLLLERPERVARARAAEVDLVVWTVNEPADALRLLDLGVTRLTTDEVEAVAQAVRTRASLSGPPADP